MKRWTNGLPGATKRLGAKMALRGLAASQPRMRADTHDGPEQIAPLQRPDTLMQLSRSLILEVHLVPHGARLITVLKSLAFATGLVAVIAAFVIVMKQPSISGPLAARQSGSNQRTIVWLRKS